MNSSSPNKRHALVLILAAAGVLAVATVRYPVLREEWYLHRLDSKSYLARKHACESLGKVGTARAVPVLFERLVRESTTAPPHLPFCSQDVIPFYSSPAAIYHHAIGDLAEAAMPFLLREIRLRALSRMSSWTKEDVPLLLQKKRTHQSGNTEEDFRSALVGLARSDASAVPRLIDGLADSELRRWVVGLLWELGPAARTAAPALRRLADSGEPEEQVAAARALDAMEAEPPSGSGEEE